MPYRRFIEAGGLTRPWALAGVVVGVAFVCEMGIMLVVAWSDGFEAAEVWLALLDAAILSLLLVPVVWLLLVRPIRRLAEQRGQLLGRLYEAQDRERARLAREIHDELGQGLTAVLLGLRAVDASTDLEVARERAAEAGAVASGCIESVRRLAQGLAPQALEAFGLVPALERLAREFNAGPKLRVTLELDPGLPRLAPLTEIAVFRIVQESLTNVVRHADATRAAVSITADAGWVRVSVLDNGVGLGGMAGRVGAGATGVQGMRERAESLGGRFTLSHSPGGGARVSVELPRTEPVEHDESVDHAHPDR